MKKINIYDWHGKELIRLCDYVNKEYPNKLSSGGIDNVYASLDSNDKVILTDILGNIYHINTEKYSLIVYPCDSWLTPVSKLIECHGKRPPADIIEGIIRSVNKNLQNPFSEMFGKFPKIPGEEE